MSLPPSTVKIKRKRTDEPVDFLRVHESNGKRQRRAASDFVFSRQADLNASNSFVPSQSLRPIIPLRHATSSQSLSRQHQQATQSTLSQAHSEADIRSLKAETISKSEQTGTPQSGYLNSQIHTNNTTIQPLPPKYRRFHISWASTKHDADEQARKRKVSTVFIERRVRPKSQDGPKTQIENHGINSKTLDSGASRPLKKPGLNARTPVPRSRDSSPSKTSPLIAAPPRNNRLPSGLVNRWDFSSDELVAQMQAYTLQEIGYNLAETEPSKTATEPIIPISKRTPSKFKPRKPAFRYAERHPDEKIVHTGSEMEVDEEFLDEDIESDGDYIIDTYIRMPAEVLEASSLQKNIGLLVLDSQPDIDEFYRDEEESEEEEDDEDEDENAENHYTADYPDEEIDSDDEFGRNAYNYRTHNASDLEEFDEDDANFSDDDVDSLKYPWAKKPWMRETRPDGQGNAAVDTDYE